MQGTRGKYRSRLGSRGQTVFTVGLAMLMAFPLVYVLFAVLQPVTASWAHIQDTLLLQYILNTAGLAVGVGLGSLIIGASCAWLVTMCDFPGRRVFQWALFLPLAVLLMCWLIPIRTCCSSRGRCRAFCAILSTGAGRLLFPADPLTGRRYFCPDLRALPLCLHAGAGGFYGAVYLRD